MEFTLRLNSTSWAGEREACAPAFPSYRQLVIITIYGRMCYN